MRRLKTKGNKLIKVYERSGYLGLRFIMTHKVDSATLRYIC